MIEDWMVAFLGKNLSVLVFVMFLLPLLLSVSGYILKKVFKILDHIDSDRTKK